MALKLGTTAGSAFARRQVAFRGANVGCRALPVSRPATVDVQAKKVCDLTGKKRNKANQICFSDKKTRKWQDPNLQHKKVYWSHGQRWVKLKISTKALKTIGKNGLDSMAAAAGIDLWKLPFEDARPQRLQYLAENKGKVPVAENPRRMKNPEKLAKSKKQPKYPVYEPGGRIVWIYPGQEEKIFGKKEEEESAPKERELTINVQQ